MKVQTNIKSGNGEDGPGDGRIVTNHNQTLVRSARSA
jgi:hypothetical protein